MKRIRLFRFSLVTMLVLVMGLAAWCGILARLYTRDSITFFATWKFTTTVFPFLIAIITLAVLSWQLEDRWQGLTWTGLLGMTPLIGLAALPLLRKYELAPPPRAAIVNPQQIALLSNAELIDKYLVEHMDEPWGWRDLVGRLADGELEQDRVDHVIELWLNSLRRKVGPDVVGSAFRTSDADKFLQAASRRDLISESRMLEIHDLFFGPGELLCNRIRETSLKFNFLIRKGNRRWSREMQLGWRLVWDVESVTIDDKPINYDDGSNTDSAFGIFVNSFGNGGELPGQFHGRLPPGDHTLKAVLKCAYVNSASASGLRSPSNSKAWPTAIRTWEEVLEQPFRVYKRTEPVFELVNDPDLDPTDYVNPSIVVRNTDNGHLVQVRLYVKQHECPVGFYCDAVIHSGSAKVDAGDCYFVKGQGGGSKFSRGAGRFVKSEIELGEFGDLVLTPQRLPALSTAEKLSPLDGLDQIWGEPMIFKNLPIDLPVEDD